MVLVHRKAFTLIELLVVIAIIALLIGILLPALGKARQSAQDLKCSANARSMGTAMELYAADNKDWYPVMPVSAQRNASKFTIIGNQNNLGVAGMFSLFQVGQAEWAGGSSTPDSALRGYIGGPAQGIGAYPDRSKTPIMEGYMDALETLKCPRDTADTHWRFPTNWYDARYTVDGTDYTEVVPVAPSTPNDVVGYNISYLYFAGFKTSEAGLLSAAPLWGDETYTNDNVTNAFYGHGYNWVDDQFTDGWGTTAEAIGFNKESGYSELDNHGAEGGYFAFTDGHVELIKTNPQKTFFARVSEFVNTYDDRGRVTGRSVVSQAERDIARKEGKSINITNPNRSSFIQTID
ncbi:MAG: type II secretion system protein [Phycisphaerales bacterium]